VQVGRFYKIRLMNRNNALGFMFLLLLGSAAIYSLSSPKIDEQENNRNEPASLIPDTLLDNQGKKVSSAQLSGKYVGLYLSASWCGPCRSFTPELIRFRSQHQDEFEVILVGGDGSSKDQAKYIEKYDMPWFAMINQSEAAKQASKQLNVEYIPCLVIIDPSGKVVSKEGVKEVRSLKKAAMGLWKSAPKDT